MATIVYGGVRYPVTNETVHAVIARIDQFVVISHSDLFEISTTDGRKVVLNLSQSFPIAFETEPDLQGQ
jgi:hypothetical protein